MLIFADIAIVLDIKSSLTIDNWMFFLFLIFHVAAQAYSSYLSPPAGEFFFQASALFLLREREFLAYFDADLCIFWRKFTELNIAVVP